MRGCYHFKRNPVIVDMKGFDGMLKKLKIAQKSEKITKKRKLNIIQKTIGYVGTCYHIQF